MQENTDPDKIVDTPPVNQQSVSDSEKENTSEKTEKPQNPDMDLDDTDDNKKLYNFYTIEALDFKRTAVRQKELHRFQDILKAPFLNVPMLVVERQEDALPLLSLYLHEQAKSDKKASFFSVTPSDFGMDFMDSDYSYDLRKSLNLGGTIIEDGDLRTAMPVYCDLIDYNDHDVLGTFVGNFLKKEMPAVLLVRMEELEDIRANVEQDKQISGGLENPEVPYEPKGLARASELRIAPLTSNEKQVYFTHHLSRMAFDNNLECDSSVIKFFVNAAIKRFAHKDVFFKTFELMNQVIVTTKENNQTSISQNTVRQVLKKMAPIHNRTKALANLDTRLKKKIFGQDEAIDTCYDSILSNLDDDYREKPTVLAFFGPSGVGKTALAEEISLALSGQKASIINMAEYADSFKVSILTGSSKGYVDSDEDGLLAKIVKKEPNAVIVLDEFEKAHPQVQQMFLGIFDKGSVFDNHAGQIDMTKITLILTSNAGVKMNKEIGFGGPINPSYVADKDLIQAKFPPELLGRIDAKIFFHPLSDEPLGRIVDKFMGMIKPRFDQLGVRVILSPNAKQKLIGRAKDPATGARPLLTIIRQKVKTPIEIAVLKKRLKRGNTVIVEDVESKNFRIISHTGRTRITQDKQRVRQ